MPPCLCLPFYMHWGRDIHAHERIVAFSGMSLTFPFLTAVCSSLTPGPPLERRGRALSSLSTFSRNSSHLLLLPWEKTSREKGRGFSKLEAAHLMRNSLHFLREAPLLLLTLGWPHQVVGGDESTCGGATRCLCTYFRLSSPLSLSSVPDPGNSLSSSYQA